MYIQQSARVDMYVINLFPILCILYVLLPKRVKSIPIGDSLDDQQTAQLNKESSSYFQKLSGKQSLSLQHNRRTSRQGKHIQNEKKSLAPDYMLALYETFSSSKDDLPKSNIVRSFKNLNSQVSKGAKIRNRYNQVPHLTQDTNGKVINLQFDTTNESQEVSPFPAGKKSHQEVESGDTMPRTDSQVHILTFNISSIGRRENINLAQLRLFLRVERDKRNYFSLSVDRTISVLEFTSPEPKQSPLDMTKAQYQLIQYRRVYCYRSDWEVFDITSTIEQWVKSSKPIHHIEIRIETIFWSLSAGHIAIETIPNTNEQPLLLVYSNDKYLHQEHVEERHELITHEFSSYSEHSAPSDIYLDNSSTRGRLNRHKRSRGFRRSSTCRRRPMYVNFEDIDWHTWIIAPRGYQAYQCVGKCHFPVNEHLSPSKHAIIQSMLHSHSPKKAVRACCVPTRLESISILYVDEQGVITYKYKYDGMVVAECGCR